MNLRQWHKVSQTSWNPEVGTVETERPKLSSKDPPLKAVKCSTLSTAMSPTKCPLRTLKGNDVPNRVSGSRLWSVFVTLQTHRTPVQAAEQRL